MPGQPGMQAPPVQQGHPPMAPHQGGPAAAQVPQVPQAPPGMQAEQPIYPAPPGYQGPGPEAMAGPGGGPGAPGQPGPHQAPAGPQSAPALAGLPAPMPGQAGPPGAVPMQPGPGAGVPAGPAAQQGRGGARAATTGRFTRGPQNQHAAQAPQFPGPPADQPEVAPGAPYMPPQQGMYGGQPAGSHLVPQQTSVSLADAVQAAHGEGFNFGQAVARDAPALWLEAVLARKPRMPSDLEARLLQDSALPIDSLLHDEVRHALRRGFWDALERARH
jgi:hypothetical protein